MGFIMEFGKEWEIVDFIRGICKDHKTADQFIDYAVCVYRRNKELEDEILSPHRKMEMFVDCGETNIGLVEEIGHVIYEELEYKIEKIRRKIHFLSNGLNQ